MSCRPQRHEEKGAAAPPSPRAAQMQGGMNAASTGGTRQPGGFHAAQADPAQLQHEDLTCPVCKSLLRDPFVTACGHTFCYACVSQHLGQRKNCPSCAAYLTFDLVYPNFLLQQLAAKVKAADRRQRVSTAERIHHLLREADSDGAGLGEADLEGLLSALYARKQTLQQRSTHDNLQLLLHFLNFSRWATCITPSCKCFAAGS